MLYKLKGLAVNMRKGYVLTSLVLGMITLVSCFFYFYPTWRHIEEVKGEILGLKEGLEEGMEKSLEKRRLFTGGDVSPENIRGLEEELFQMKAVIPGQEDLQDFFAQLEKVFLSQSFNFERHTIEIGKISSCGDSRCDCFDIVLTLSGPQGEIVDYIRSIEGYSRALEVRQVSLDRKEEDLFFCTLHVRVLVNYN